MKLRDAKGFTLIEVVVVAAIIAILAGILVPLVLKEIDEARLSRTWGDIRSISTAVFVFKKDTTQWPVMDATCNPNVTFLSGDGNLPANLMIFGYNTTVSSSFNDHLPQDTNGCYTNWKGAYMTRVTADPWGNAYFTNADAFALPANRPVWIISAGPNGALETPSFSTTLFGDDIGLRLK